MEDEGPTTRSKTALAIANETDPTVDALRHVAEALRRLAMGPMPAHQTTGESLDVKIFSGQDRSYSINDFIDRFSLVTRAFEYTDEKRAKQLPLYLAKGALEFYKSLSRETQKNFQRTSRALIDEFTSSQMLTMSAIRIRQRHLQQGETVADFANDLRKLGRLAYDNADSHSLDRFLLSDFLVGLPPNLRYERMRCLKTTLALLRMRWT